MADRIVDILSGITENKELIIFICAMIPLIELKGAIPIGMKLTGDLLTSALFSWLGSSFVFFIIFFLLIPVMNLLKKIPFVSFIVKKIEAMLKKKAEKMEKENNGNGGNITSYLMKALFIFVAVPFPVTGVWTGTAIAVFLGLKFRESVLPVVLGNLLAGSIITLLTYFFAAYVNIIIYVLFAAALIMLILSIIKIARAKPEE